MVCNASISSLGSARRLLRGALRFAQSPATKTEPSRPAPPAPAAEPAALAAAREHALPPT